MDRRGIPILFMLLLVETWSRLHHIWILLESAILIVKQDYVKLGLLELTVGLILGLTEISLFLSSLGSELQQAPISSVKILFI